MPKIIITVGPDGETSLETKGYRGKGCSEASRPYEESLGIKTSDRKTAEYHQAETNPTRNKLGN